MANQKKNYHKLLESILKEISTQEVTGAADSIREKMPPKLLLHACCAPCSSYVLEYLSQSFQVYLLYYNPNIVPKSEHDRRREELERLLLQMPAQNPVVLVPAAYEPQRFAEIAKGLEEAAEGGERCVKCYGLRLEEAASCAKELGCEYFTTTLTISPMKNADKINEIGEMLALRYGVKHLPSDFKKQNGYKRSLELSDQYGLYRQDYCGCIYSKKQRDIRAAEKAKLEYVGDNGNN